MKIQKGYVNLPCFTVEMVNEAQPELTCNKFLSWIWEFFFSSFWNGKVTICEEKERDLWG